MTTASPPQGDVRCEAVLRPGNTNCAGCGMSIGYQFLDQALDREPIILVIPACCGIVTAGAFPTSAYGVPTVASTFAGAAAVATGVSTVAALNNEDHPVICWTGDGGTYDIGLATLSAAAERNENMIYVCYDNEIYGNTGGQRSSATPEGVFTTTSPRGQLEHKKDIMAIMIAHRIPYVATLSIAHRDDFLRKVQTARKIQGFRFLLLLSPCPTGWKSEPEESVDLIRHAVGCGVFPLYEVYDGVRYRINHGPDGTPIEEYANRQRRFTASNVDTNALHTYVQQQWHYLEEMARRFPTADEGEESTDQGNNAT